MPPRIPVAGRSLASVLTALALVVGCEGGPDEAFRQHLGTADESDPLERDHRVTIHSPPELESVATGQVGPNGEPLRVACINCHSIPGLAPVLEERAEDVGPPHEGIDFSHGSNRCSSCHDPTDRVALRLADGRSIPMRDALELCAQCHGPQYRDYRNGSHGGMRGYWDRESGSRERNHCIDCHDPHRPAFPRYQPMPPPADRHRPEAHE